MSIYKKPGSYVERINNVVLATDLPSTAIGGIIGQVVRGVPNKAIKLTSWTQFENKFAKGIADPFTLGNVADAVYGFFQNGGQELYVVRVVEGGVKASGELETMTFNALEEGAWGNDLSIAITKNELLSRQVETYDLVISLQGVKVEELKNLTTENFVEVINSNSAYVTVEGSEIAEGTVTLSNGAEDKPNVATFKRGLACFDIIKDVNLLAITGVNETGVQEALVEYCDTRGTIFPIIDAVVEEELENLMDYKDKFSSHMGAMYYPRIEVQSPVTGKSKFVSPSGHIMGMFARTDAKRGVHKAPAGLEATIKGAISVERELSDVEIGILNDYEINCIIPKPNSGIVSWGARLLKTNGERQFVSDIRLDLYVEESIRRNTEWAVFEPKDEQLFNKVTAQLTGMLTNMWKEGKFYGSTPEEAFFVQCNAELNPDILSSELHISVGYAKKKPAEFVITKVSHKSN